jgi:hypothetical protein
MSFLKRVKAAPTYVATKAERMRMASKAIGHELFMAKPELIECRDCSLSVSIPHPESSAVTSDELFNYAGCLLAMIIWHGNAAADEDFDMGNLSFNYTYTSK